MSEKKEVQVFTFKEDPLILDRPNSISQDYIMANHLIKENKFGLLAFNDIPNIFSLLEATDFTKKVRNFQVQEFLIKNSDRLRVNGAGYLIKIMIENSSLNKSKISKKMSIVEDIRDKVINQIKALFAVMPRFDKSKNTYRFCSEILRDYFNFFFEYKQPW